jgi:hypothetical protein
MDPKALASLTFSDITAQVTAAAAELTPEHPLLHAKSYDAELGLHCVEMMNPQLDQGAGGVTLPTIASRLGDGSLPLPGAGLAPADLVSVLDLFLELFSSFLHGNSVPHTLLHSLYLHPEALSHLSARVGRPQGSLYAHTPRPTGADLESVPVHFRPFLEIGGKVARVDAAAAASAPAPAVAALEPGSASHTLSVVLLAASLATLKAAGLVFSTIFAADFYREEDFAAIPYGSDLAWGVPVDTVLALLVEAEAAVAQAEPGAAALAAAAAEEAAAVRAKIAALPEDDLIQAAEGASSAAAAQPKKKGKDKKAGGGGGESGAGHSSAPPAPAVVPSSASFATPAFAASLEAVKAPAGLGTGERVVPAPKAPAGGAPAYEPLGSAGGAGSLGASLLLRLRYLRVYISLLRQLHLSSGRTGPLGWGLVFPTDDVHLASTLAWDLLQGVRKTSTLGGGAEDADGESAAAAAAAAAAVDAPAAGAPKMTAADLANPDAVAGAAAVAAARRVPGFFPEYESEYLPPQRPRCTPLRPFAASLRDLERHLAALAFVSQVPALASHNPFRPLACATSPGSYLPHVQPSPRTLAELALPARCLVVDSVIPVPRIPDSGLFDSAPAQGPPGSEGAEAPAAGSSGVAGQTGSRRHVSFDALWQVLEDFSRRNADIVARVFLLLIVYAPPSPAARAAAEAEAAVQQVETPPGVLPAEDSWRHGYARSPALLGTHTLLEVLVGSMQDAGAPAEFLYSIEGRRYAELLSTLLFPSINLFCLTRTRIRRGMDAILAQDWQSIVADSAYIEDFWAAYLQGRIIALDRAATAGAAPAALDGGRYTAAVPEDRRLLTILWSLFQVSRPLSLWAESFVCSLLLVHTRIGIETGLYHPDESLAVHWHVQVLTERLERIHVQREIITGVRWLLPEMGAVSAESRALYAAGTGPLLHRVLDPLPTTTPAAATLSLPGADQDVTDSAEAYFAGVTKAVERRGAKRETALFRAHKNYNDVLLRALVVARFAGLWTGLGVEAVHRFNEEEVMALQLGYSHVTAGARPPAATAGAGGASFFRHPVLAYEQRWAVFEGFPSFANSLSFLRYTLTFAADTTPQALDSFASSARERAESAISCADIVMQATSAALQGGTGVLGNGLLTEPGSPLSSKPAPDAAAAAVAVKTKGKGKKGKGGKGAGDGEAAEEASSAAPDVAAPSSLSVLWSSKDETTARALAEATAGTMKSIVVICRAQQTHAYLTYLFAVLTAEEASWQAELCAADAAAGADGAINNLKRVQVTAAVQERKLAAFEKDAAAKLAPAGIVLPPRASFQSPFLYDLLRAGEEARRRARAEAAAAATLENGTGKAAAPAPAAAPPASSSSSLAASSAAAAGSLWRHRPLRHQVSLSAPIPSMAPYIVAMVPPQNMIQGRGGEGAAGAGSPAATALVKKA